MRKLLIATHGRFADGIKNTMEIIIGEVEQADVLCAYTTQDFDMDQAAKDYISALGDEDELIIAADVAGGSVANTFAKYCSEKVIVLAGCNFPMLVTLALQLDSDTPVEELVKEAMEAGKDGICCMINGWGAASIGEPKALLSLTW